MDENNQGIAGDTQFLQTIIHSTRFISDAYLPASMLSHEQQNRNKNMSNSNDGNYHIALKYIEKY